MLVFRPFLIACPRGGVERSSLLSRPVILGSLLLIWLFGLSLALIVLASKYQVWWALI